VSTSTPLVFRPSVAQRGLAALLCVGSWLVGVRAMAAFIESLPRLTRMLRAADLAGEPTWSLWIQLVAALAALVVAGGLLLLSILGFLMVEGSVVLVDEIGISSEHHLLPGPIGRWLGAGRLIWKQVSGLKRSGPFFVLLGGAGGGLDPTQPGRLKFLLVEDLERLVNLILERSSNLRFPE
jgi:hypothetical protein